MEEFFRANIYLTLRTSALRYGEGELIPTIRPFDESGWTEMVIRPRCMEKPVLAITPSIRFQ